MRPILAREGRATLAAFARRRLLAAFDFDGTLAPIVHVPEHALLGPRTRARYFVRGQAQVDSLLALLVRLRG